ncbi:LexA family transcriptional regulator [Photobacterium leiognathi]|uniref:hypothetical protein n=1 Tax=Photobacterium leiognathi TaxID=553611 RepID=UPI00298261E5|nr:hypothetical protein [Photobacterium leiognathi]
MIQSSVDKVEGTNLDQWLMADINTSWIALNSGNFRHLKHNDILIVHRRKPSCDPLLVICCLDGQFVVAELDDGTLINESKSIHTTLQSENLIEGYVVGSIRRYR